MADSAIAAGVTITELRVTGARGGASTRFGRRSGALDANHLVIETAPAMAITTISAPTIIKRQGRCMEALLLLSQTHNRISDSIVVPRTGRIESPLAPGS
jgi:hypothetical protein